MGWFRLRAALRDGFVAETRWAAIQAARPAPSSALLPPRGNVSRHEFGSGGRVVIYQPPQNEDSTLHSIVYVLAGAVGLTAVVSLVGLTVGLVRGGSGCGRRVHDSSIAKQPDSFALYNRVPPPVLLQRRTLRRGEPSTASGVSSLVPSTATQRVRGNRDETGTTAIDINPSSLGLTPVMRSTPAAHRFSSASFGYPRVHTLSVIAQVEQSVGFSDYAGDMCEVESGAEDTTTRRLETKLRSLPSPSSRRSLLPHPRDRRTASNELLEDGENASASCPELVLEGTGDGEMGLEERGERASSPSALPGAVRCIVDIFEHRAKGSPS